MNRVLSILAAAVIGLVVAAPIVAQQAVLQRGYDPGLTGANLSETKLTTANVSATTFGLLSTLPVDASVYAQPLYVSNVAVAGLGTHNVLYVATMNDTLYAFDADNGSQLWSVNFASSVGATPVAIANFTFSGNKNIVGNVGILSTPVIDAATNIMYLVACTLENNTLVYRLHAVNVTSGTEPYPNVVISGSFSGATFNARYQTQRASLTLANGQIVFAFGAVELEYSGGYSGWVMAYDEKTLAQSGVFATVATGTQGGGVWQSGRPPVVDSSGYVYVFTGNGYTTGYNGTTAFSESALKLNPANHLALVDWFTPSNWSSLDSSDQDLASSGPLLIPNTSPSLLAGGGKAGTFYLIKTTGMGHETSANTGAQQQLSVAPQFRGGPVYWQRSAANGGPLLYHWGPGDTVKAFAFTGAAISTTPTYQGNYSPVYPGGILAISANGEQAGTGILWATLAPSGDLYDDATDPGVLYALDASNVSNVLWNSTMNSARDSYGNFAKFVPPTIANGKVYVATFSNKIAVYGLLAASTPTAAAPTFSPAPGAYTGTQQVTLSDTTSGSAIHYTTDGTTATASSATYAAGAPLTIAATETVHAIAVASGYYNSTVSTGTYTIAAAVTPTVATPTFSPAPGSYSAAQQVTLSDATPGSAIHYTTDGTAPISSSPTYVAGTPLTVSATETLQAVAVASGYANSTVASGTYTITASVIVVPVTLSSADNVVGIGKAGTAVPSGGLDGSGAAYATDLLGSSVTWAGATFTLGTAGAVDAVDNQVVTIPTGTYSSLKLLASGVNGNQANQVFVITYTDGTTTSITQSLSDWFTPQSYSGESVVSTMSYRLTSTGAKDARTFYLYGYSLALNTAKTVKSVTLPKNRNVVVLAMDLTPASAPVATVVPVSLSASANVMGIGTAGKAVISGGLDTQGYAYASNLLGASLSWSSATFAFGTAGAVDTAANTTVTLPAGRFSSVKMLATGVNGNQGNQAFVVTYTDGTTTAITQSLSDWFSPQSYAGESTALTMASRLTPTGASDARNFKLYGYSLAINNSKTVKSITLPKNRNVVVLALDLVP